MTNYIKLKRAPMILWTDPDRGTCFETLEMEDGDWICPLCGTCWGPEQYGGGQGLLYEEWSGEVLEGEPLDERDAYHESTKRRANK